MSRGKLGGFALVLALAVTLVAAGAAQASSIFFIRSGQIWVANPDGSNAKQVTTDGGGSEPYVWVSAAKSTNTLAYLRDDTVSGANPRQIFGTIDANGTGSTVNPDNANMQSGAVSEATSVSIDAAGNRVAWPKGYLNCFVNCGYTYFAAYAVGADGTGEQHLITAAAVDVTFGDPAGSTLLFEDLSAGYNSLPHSCVSNSENYVLVHRMPAPTSGTPGSPSFYCVPGMDLVEPALRPDGKLIAAVEGASPRTLVTIPIGGTASSTVASPVTKVTPAGVPADKPDFSPDGSQIAFEAGGGTIDTVPASGGTPVPVLTNATSPAWSPFTQPGASGPGGNGPSGVAGPTCSVPKLKRETVRKAKRTLHRAGCTLGHRRKVFSARVKRGRIISQSPRAGSVWPAGTAVKVKVSKGP